MGGGRGKEGEREEGSLSSPHDLICLHTVRLAAVEVTELAALLTTHRYSPSSLSATAAMV